MTIETPNTEPRRALAFGYHHPAIQDSKAAWGARAIIKNGVLDIVWDRCDRIGTDADFAPMRAILEGGALARVHRVVKAYYNQGVVRNDKAAEVTLYLDDTIMIVGNTNGSYGYMYLAAFYTDEAAGQVRRTLYRTTTELAAETWLAQLYTPDGVRVGTFDGYTREDLIMASDAAMIADMAVDIVPAPDGFKPQPLPKRAFGYEMVKATLFKTERCPVKDVPLYGSWILKVKDTATGEWAAPWSSHFGKNEAKAQLKLLKAIHKGSTFTEVK
jgi:hypothetical protein